MNRKLGQMFIIIMLCLPIHDSRAVGKNEDMFVHFIDVGQADCILIQTPKGKNILIDAGDEFSGGKIVNYLKEHEVDTLDAIISTHPHHDHIGSMAKIITTFKVKAYYMPDIPYNTKLYQQLLDTIHQTELMVFHAKAGDDIQVEPDINIKIIGPIGKGYDTLNDYSYVLMLIHKHNRFLLMGDAGEQSETDLLSKNVNLQANVIKIGHHGANTGTTLPFLKKVNPDYAVITVSKKSNRLPSRDVINRLKYLKIPTYRTDILGNIVAESDGEMIRFHIGQN